jgi:hypothetical protein
MSGWRCRAYRAWLVDAAAGALASHRQDRLNAHLAVCAGCTADLAALRDVPALLRTSAVPDPGEDVWRRQRQAIGRAIRHATPPQPAWIAWQLWADRWSAWRRPVAAVVSVALALAVLRVAPPRLRHAPRPPAPQVTTLDPEALDELSDVVAPHDEMLSFSPHDDDPLLAALALHGLVGPTSEPLLFEAHDLDDDVLDGVDDLLGDVA